jgi:HAMP domain-containing protein
MANERKRGMGLLPRLVIGVFVPILLAFLIIGNIVFFSINFGNMELKSIRDLGFAGFKEMSAASLKEFTSSMNKLGEKAIQNKAEDVAKQVEVYVRLKGIKKADLSKNPLLREIAVQKVGDTGYTALHDINGVSYLHADPRVEGTDLHALATKLPGFWKIIETGLQTDASGYYDWRDHDGSKRPKYMYVAHVKGTDLMIAATTYIDEFSKPARAIATKLGQMEKTYSSEYSHRFKVFGLVVLIDLALLLAVIYLYSYSVVRPVRRLVEVADKISMGDLKTSVDVNAKGEVGALAESIERMQMSVRAAIERLQKKRREEKNNSGMEK